MALTGIYGSVVLRSGGDLVESTGSEVTFRFLEFHSELRKATYSVGSLGEAGIPRCLHLAGTLSEVE